MKFKHLKYRQLRFVTIALLAEACSVAETPLGAAPTAPKREKIPSSVLSKERDRQLQSRVKLQPRQRPDDPIQSFTWLPAFAGSRLLYAYYVPFAGDESDSGFYLVLRSVAEQENQQSSVTTYRIELEAFEPQFSPNGRYLLFKAAGLGGIYDLNGVHLLYFLDLKTKRVSVGPKQFLGYRMALPWSPDSRYFAYIVGGNAVGQLTEGQRAFHIKIFDVQTQRSRVVQDVEQVPRVVWTPRNTLLFTGTGQQQSVMSREPYSPTIYEAALAGGQGKPLFEGDGPIAPSPDGQWIAYRGTALTVNRANAQLTAGPTSQKDQPKDLEMEHALATGFRYLCLYNRAQRKHYLISSVNFFNYASPPSWTPDSKHIAVFTSSSQLQVVDVATQTSKTLTVRLDVDGSPAFLEYYQPLGVSSDGKFLYVKHHQAVSRAVRKAGEYATDEEPLSYVQAINLEDGSVSTLAKIKNDLGVDWHPRSPAVPQTEPGNSISIPKATTPKTP